EVLQRLLRKDPRDRYQSAEAVHADLEMIDSALRRGDGEPDFVVGLRDRRGTVTEAAFVGRARELGKLDALVQQVSEGRAARAALPQLAEAFGLKSSTVLGPETFGEARSIQALAHLLDALGSSKRPALIILDDCQWADDLAVKLMLQWAWTRERRREAGSHV